MGNRRSNKKNYVRPGGFVSIYRDIMKSPAYRDLKPTERCLLLEFQSLCWPHDRNGLLSISTANAAELLNVSEKTACKAFYILQDHGFIKLQLDFLWQQRKARQWRLTCMPYNGQKPTDEWKQWEPGKPTHAAVELN